MSSGEPVLLLPSSSRIPRIRVSLVVVFAQETVTPQMPPVLQVAFDRHNATPSLTTTLAWVNHSGAASISSTTTSSTSHRHVPTTPPIHPPHPPPQPNTSVVPTDPLMLLIQHLMDKDKEKDDQEYLKDVSIPSFDGKSSWSKYWSKMCSALSTAKWNVLWDHNNQIPFQSIHPNAPRKVHQANTALYHTILKQLKCEDIFIHKTHLKEKGVELLADLCQTYQKIQNQDALINLTHTFRKSKRGTNTVDEFAAHL